MLSRVQANYQLPNTQPCFQGCAFRELSGCLRKRCAGLDQAILDSKIQNFLAKRQISGHFSRFFGEISGRLTFFLTKHPHESNYRAHKSIPFTRFLHETVNSVAHVTIEREPQWFTTLIVRQSE